MGCHCKDPQPYCTYRVEQPKVRTFPNDEKHPSYLRQPSDDFDVSFSSEPPLGNVGPWATGRVVWNLKSGMTGIRPVVDRYSITQHSPKDWRKNNQDMLDKASDTHQEFHRLKHNVKCSMDTVSAGADKHQSQNKIRLEERIKEVKDCQKEIEGLIKDFREEIVSLTETKIKLKFSLPALKMPESIAGECIDRRTTRLEADLVNDEVETELIKELSLIHNIREMYVQIIADIDKQILANKACKDQLEQTWSDKKVTCELESVNACLKNEIPIVTFHGGAARILENQSSPESWAIYNVTVINAAKDELAKSRQLRETANKKLMGDAIRDLRNQADVVYAALLKRIDETNRCRETFERELRDVLGQISDAESLYDGLFKLLRSLEYNTKVVETRLDNRQQRPRVENCRDLAQYGLLDEVKYLNENKAELKRQIDHVDKTVAKLYEARCNLEYFILTKRRSLYVDQQRCLAYRERYPDAVTLTGGGGAGAP